MRLLLTVFTQTASFHILNCFLLSQYRQVQVFHKVSFCYFFIFTLEILYYKIFYGCVFCFLNIDTSSENEPDDETLLVTTISFELFLMSYHFYRICAGIKGVFTVLWDVFTIIEMIKSVLMEKGANAILLIMFLYNLPDSLLSLVCILKSDSSEFSIRSRRYPKLEILYALVYTGTNILLSMSLIRALGSKQLPPLLMLVGYFFKILSTSLVLNFLAMILRRRYVAAVTSFFKQLFYRTFRLEINYHEHCED